VRKPFVFLFIALSIAFAALASFARETDGPGAGGGYSVKGTITDIKVDTLDLALKDEKGRDHLIKASDSKVLQGISIGDSVSVKLDGGKAVLIQKVEDEGPGAGGGYGK